MNKQLQFQPPSTTLRSYGMALVLTIIAMFIALIINSFITGYVKLIFLAFVVLSTLWGGIGPGLVASFLSSILGDYFFLAPVGSFFTNADGFLFLGVMAVMSLLVSRIKQRRDRSEQVWLDTKSQLETILKGFTDGILAQDLNGQPIFANEAAARMVGLTSAKEMVSTPVSVLQKLFELYDEDGNVIQPDSLPRNRALEQGKSSELTVRLRHRETNEERWFTFRSAIVWDNNNQPRLTMTTLQDISEQKRQAGDRLKLLFAEEMQRRRMQTILDNVPGIVWETKINPANNLHEVVFVSNYTQQMLGYSVDELLKMPDFWDKVLQQGEGWDQALEETTTLLDDKLGKSELRIDAKDGRVIPVEAHITTLFDDNEQVIGACGVLIDVTERKKAEMNLAHFALELQRSNKELQQFAYIASHDLQEPLRMVGSYLQLIESRYADKLDKDGHEFIAFAVDGATRMKELIQGLLMYSRVETEAKNFVQINCQDVVKEVQRLLAVSIEESGAVITVDALPEIRADERLITQLFQNLIGNAIKYRSDRKPEIHIGVTRKDEDKWLFAIRDNGIGIESQYLERIFVIFQRLHSQKQHSGTGIGLSICKKVVERHGGYIWAESEIGVGTTFYFTIPV